MSELSKCLRCGDTTPTGHELCWCCEHTKKLHPMEKPPRCEDKCDIIFEKKDR